LYSLRLADAIVFEWTCSELGTPEQGATLEELMKNLAVNEEVVMVSKSNEWELGKYDIPYESTSAKWIRVCFFLLTRERIPIG